MKVIKMFEILTTGQLLQRLKNAPISREIKQLHYHHTWKPNHSNYDGNNGIQLQENMKRYHVENLKWSDIGQHLTLLPDGRWVTGRDINRDPASIVGWNAGALAIEMMGNFNHGGDVFGGAQAESAYQLGAFFLENFKRNPEDIKFHRDNSSAGNATCPGDTIDKAIFVDEILKRFKGEKIVVEVKTAEQALETLQKAGIIQSPDYWLKVVDVVNYQRDLLINMANYIRK